MTLLATEAIVLHVFDYLESSRIVRLVTRDGGMRSGLARGARKSRRRFGSGLDLFAQGTAFLHSRPGRELDTLSGFEDVRTRSPLAADLERFHGAETIAEIALRFGMSGGDTALFDAVARVLDALAEGSAAEARERTLAGAWQLVDTLGFGPALLECVECGSALGDEDAVLFDHVAGGVLCPRCAALSSGGRTLPAPARAAIASWLGGELAPSFCDSDARAHQRLLREFLGYHLHDDGVGSRPMCAYELWERGSWRGTAA